VTTLQKRLLRSSALLKNFNHRRRAVCLTVQWLFPPSCAGARRVCVCVQRVGRREAGKKGRSVVQRRGIGIRLALNWPFLLLRRLLAYLFAVVGSVTHRSQRRPRMLDKAREPSASVAGHRSSSSAMHARDCEEALDVGSSQRTYTPSPP
jgi:hypothetical protein